ncbi:D-alanyl-D-alanine carboxypeptidase [Rhodobacterales bacterium HKCCSP123]|nr:D-alanyl-D-alanine carboxypeptidase [Rhodobacterales bacterium HKCCSP123]
MAMAAVPLRAAPYAAMVMDARTGEVLHSRNADTRLHPASLTKMMTLYIAFEAVRLGEITLDTPVRISERAAAEPPSELGLRAGSTIRFRYLIRAAAIRSANDAATAIAEAIEGSEAAFARRMNRTARALGMTRTTFRNAHGLTEDGHLSTAHDMTILGRRLFYDYPQYYNIFSRREEDAGIATVRNTNRALLDAYRGADGIKTGYTRAAGFNLVASAERGGVRILATVFGGRSAAWRNQRIMELFDMGFARAPATARVRQPDLPSYEGGGDDDSPFGRAERANGLVSRSIRPQPRPGPPAPASEPAPELLAAIEEAVGEALADPAPEVEVAENALPRPAPQTAEAAEDSVAAAVAMPDTAPVPRPVAPQASLVVPPRPADMPEPEVVAAPLEPEVVTRASSTGSRLYGVSLGAQPSHHAAERLLLRTALSEIGTFDQALRRVVRRNGGYEARFQGLTEDQAARACARLSARAIVCETFGPAS